MKNSLKRKIVLNKIYIFGIWKKLIYHIPTDMVIR